MKNRFLPGVIVAAAMALVGTNGCSSSNPLTDAQGALCCSAFQPGTDMTTANFGVDASIQGQMAAFANATGDLSAVAGTALADVTGACRNIAVDLGDDPTGGTGTATGGANGKTGTDLLNYWCGEATNNIKTAVAASGSISLTVVPPECDVSIQATASCQGSCDVSGKCDIKANPPTCTGGTLEASCTGTCTASASAPSFDCTGSCSGTCTGGCTASGGVECTGKCDGTCTASTTGSGAQADGTCKGKCSGTCSVTAPSATCSGTCSGQCNANCTAAPGQASATCSGTCSVAATPLSCKGGKLSGGCQVDANCQANCNASAKAKASCTPPSVTLVASGTAGAQFNTLAITIQKNLPALLLVIQAQGKDFADDISAAIQGGATLTTSGNLNAAGTVCVADMVAAATSGSANFAATLTAAVNVSTAIGGPTG
jgi:hypothetical protein